MDAHYASIVRLMVAMGMAAATPLPTLAAAGRMREANDGDKGCPMRRVLIWCLLILLYALLLILAGMALSAAWRAWT
jgi:hypothetical protein